MPRLITTSVVEAGPATARMTRVRVRGDELARLTWAPGQRVRVLVGPSRTLGLRRSSSMRTYSVRRLVEDELELIALDRGGDDPGETWARGCRTGRRVRLFEPSGDLTLRPGETLDTALAVLDGDEIMYHPGAFSPAGRAVLRRLFPDALLVDAEDASVFALNAVSDGFNVVLPETATRLAEVLRERGFNPIGVDLTELLKGGGGVKCCTLELRH